MTEDKTVLDKRRQAAARALAEAADRRVRKDATAAARPAEKGGQTGPEPTRYGDWESKGIISDF